MANTRGKSCRRVVVVQGNPSMDKMEAAHRYGPGHLNYYARRDFGVDFDQLDAEQQQQAQAAKKAYYADFAWRGSIGRRRSRARRLRARAAELVTQADQLDADLDAEEIARAGDQP